MFKTLCREKTGEVVRVIFPRCYGIGYVCGVLSMVTLLAGTGIALNLGFFLLATMSGCAFFAGLVAGPRALKEQIKSASDMQATEALQLQFD
ncbi:MAG: DUF4149 domain-containing protein [Nitrospinota bacterium]|nr:DUF4149 domain-containing protein [Nitrospinota bacterium]